MKQAVICDAVRTPFGRYGGALSKNGVECLSRHTQEPRDLDARAPERRQDFLAQQLARMHRRQPGPGARFDRQW